jgi:hypothetical protein
MVFHLALNIKEENELIICVVSSLGAMRQCSSASRACPANNKECRPGLQWASANSGLIGAAFNK